MSFAWLWIKDHRVENADLAMQSWVYICLKVLVCLWQYSFSVGCLECEEILVPNPDINCPRATASASRCNLHFNVHQQEIQFFLHILFPINEMAIEFSNLPFCKCNKNLVNIFHISIRGGLEKKAFFCSLFYWGLQTPPHGGELRYWLWRVQVIQNIQVIRNIQVIKDILFNKNTLNASRDI